MLLSAALEEKDILFRSASSLQCEVLNGGGCKKTRPNWARKVRELILFNVLCTLYCGRGCLSLESEGKEMRGCVSLESGIFVADGTTGRDGKPEVF